MSNDTSSGNSTFNNGQDSPSNALTQQTPDAGVWHQSLELFFICFCCFFIVVLIVARTWVRRRNSKKFSADDYWIMFAGLLTIPYWVCQIATNRYGSGLHIEVIPDSAGKYFLGFERGWAAYYFITSMIKVSELLLILGILPARFRKTRIFIYVLCTCIMALGLALSLAWFFQCLPVAANFNWNVMATSCIAFGIPRYVWVGLGVSFDACITIIPVVLLRTMMMKSQERTVLQILFSANILATIILIAGIAGIYYTGDPFKFTDYTWLETIYIVMQNLETLAYTIGASAPVLYRSIVGKSESQGSTGRTVRYYKGSGGSGDNHSDGTTLTNNNSRSFGTRNGSIFKPAAIFSSKSKGTQKGEEDFPMEASPTSPQLYHDKQRLNSESAAWA